ncbi:MAG: Gfo/Idh/MocA family oxidoreductase [Phycisphaerae bacterium]|jgi:predicted dehydrogenase
MSGHGIYRISRRGFLKGARAGAAGLAGAGWLARSASAQSRPAGANERIRLAFVGTRGQGQFNLKIFKNEPGVEVPVVCDVNLRAADAARKIAGEKTEVVQDYRRLLDRRDIDAFVVCTPDHWHAIITIQACQAGKDVYVEKPLSLCVAEGRRMVQAARKHDRVVQVGTQQRSGEHYAQAREIVRSGQLGKIGEVFTWIVENRWPGVRRPPREDPPSYLDWDLWLGPRPKVPYDRSRCSGAHRFYWDYAGGQMTDMGTHHMETIQWFMDVQAPLSAAAAGTKVMDQEPYETPDTVRALWEYPGWNLEFMIREACGYNREVSQFGILFHGGEATLYIDRAGFEVLPGKGGPPTLVVGTPRAPAMMPEALSRSHIRNFLDCMRTRQPPNADVEIGHRATTVCHLGNIAYRTGRKIRWDAQREQIIDDPEAAGLLTRAYRAPYLLPEV